MGFSFLSLLSLLVSFGVYHTLCYTFPRFSLAISLNLDRNILVVLDAFAMLAFTGKHNESLFLNASGMSLTTWCPIC